MPSPSDSGKERRDSPRVPMRFLVRCLKEGGSYDEFDGDLAVGGAYFLGRYPPPGDAYELRFRLPGSSKDIRATGELLRADEAPHRMGLHFKFVDLPLEDELAVARFLEGLPLP